MSRRRFLDRMRREPPSPAAAPVVCPVGFMACPTVLRQGVAADPFLWQQRIYEMALEQAKAVVRPSILERFQADLMN
jgi:hypothetical protein